MPHDALLKWVLILGGWTLLGVLFAGQAVFHHSMMGEPVMWNALLLKATGVYAWAALTPLIFWISHRYPLGRQRWKRSLLAHGLLCLVIVPIDASTYILADEYLFHAMTWSPGLSFGAKYLHVLSSSFGFSTFFYAGVVGVSHAFDYYRLYRERELRATELEARLAHARLQALRAQLQPHFLFNTLHAVSALVHEDPAAAERMIAYLSDLLRMALKSDGTQEVPLQQEIDLLRPYLEIEKTRFADRLSVTWDVADDTLAGRVPSLVLQPLVENAVRHGISTRKGPGLIEIRAFRRDGALHLAVRDNGAGFDEAGATPRDGVGLGNTRARLRQLYGDAHRFDLRNAPGGGGEVSIQIPWREEARA